MLAQLRQDRYPVPDGFCVGVGAWRDERWRDQVREALERLAPPWAVRSSSTVEDAAGRTFAGLFTTITGIADPRSLLEAIDEVRTSGDSGTISAYAGRAAGEPVTSQMAVLVQTLIAADAAGVAFGRDPVTGADTVSIEANHGLGETVVDGSVIPDTWTVAPDATITARQIGSKHEKVVASTAPTGARRVQTSEARAMRTVPDR